MDLMRELIEESKLPRKASQAVYHRDYLKTKKKPYRKYDPKARSQKNESVDIEEGAWDFVKGAAGHIGNSIKQGVQNTVAAGQQSSMAGELTKLVSQLFQSLKTLQSLKKPGAPAQQQQQPQQQQPQQQAPTPAQRQPQAQSAAPAAFKASQKPKTVPGKFGPEYQFASFLMTLDNEDFITEGVWDFVKGAAGHAVGQVKQGVQQTVAAGQQASNDADTTAATQQAMSALSALIQVIQKMGQGGVEQFKQAAKATCGSSYGRVIEIVLGKAKRQGVQLQ